ncbi:S-adenosyl-L-methionine-dependent methyltransferase [Mollisia scopiformis]|uniref:S-adenosyl-L-methionine-dependent methyltransferase n=1 Tax=Mollisia scopiformis TaxID=149040 RepID=A0A194XNF7_MOLSC|nr:S-adenosyl-L-methionine-dependent methyltransferase [Mollisia scopiformis]KUJ21287.1 S-adenosyl-L-methionine-dependent methyltransferase [Mollisia scopiformis]
MSSPAPASVPVAEKTFNSYTPKQGEAYAQARGSYNPSLFKAIIEHHTSTGGKLNTLLDVGCGPGTAVRALAPHFVQAIGIDPSGGMISTARSLGGTASEPTPIRFETATAEDLGTKLSPPLEEESIDLITAATAAHWFNMDEFWPQTARLLKPGGTVAIWSAGDAKMHSSMPAAEILQPVLEDIWIRELKPFQTRGNEIARELYVDLPLPWTISSPVAEFDESTFYRKVWDPETDEEFLWRTNTTTGLDTWEKMMSTISPVTRWREAHPDKVGTDGDVVKLFRKEIEKFQREAGVEEGKEWVKSSLRGVLLMVKKKA